ncbi:hypothetical protein KP509_12G071000 [Ceratopteris richardii]|uniref:DUF3511 domain protein n=1 Tax=Ceratopteris richardii TaxID=49495 RepID=A0A8T2TMM1_CERRI|nr:hypothetical protein KP509_12G071000 [Ceratopteris richardii]
MSYEADSGKVYTGEVCNGKPWEETRTSPEQYVHRRRLSDIYVNCTPSPYPSDCGGGDPGAQVYAPSSRPDRDRRTRSWDLTADPELLRKKRLASYKAYTVEGKLKSTVKKGLHWIKGKYNKIIYGFK